MQPSPERLLRWTVALSFAAASSALWWPHPAAASASARIKEVAAVQGVRSNQLVGYGLVVGLDGTGDQTTQTPFTTQSLNAEQLQALSDEVGSARTLLVCCGAFRVSAATAASRYPNLTVKKIPKMVLQKCEWGHDDYSLNVENLPQAPKPVRPMAPQANLFDDSGGRE